MIRWRCEIRCNVDNRSVAKFIRAKTANDAADVVKKLFGQVYIVSVVNDGKVLEC